MYQSIPGQYNPITNSMNNPGTPMNSGIPLNYAPSSVNGRTVLTPKSNVLSAMDSSVAPSQAIGGTRPTTNTLNASTIVPSIDPITSEIDNAYNQRISSLNNIANQVRAYEPNIYSQADSIFNASKSALDTGKASALGSIDQSSTDAAKRKQDATIAATRLYNELLQGGQQRYGGSSSAGQAFSEIANVEQQRRGAATEADYGQTMRQLMALRNDTENKYTTGLAQAAAQKETAISQAKQALQNKLIEIEQMKDSAAADKSAQRLAALQEYRNNIFDINAQIASFTQNLTAQRDQTNSIVDRYTELAKNNSVQSGNATNAFFNNTTVDPNSSLSGTPYTQSGNQGTQYVGDISSRLRDPNKDLFTSNFFG